jgi:hypothetical protein
MAAGDLVFTHAPHGAELVFGEQEADLAVSTVVVSASLPDLAAHIVALPPASIVVALAFDDPAIRIGVTYDVNVDRPTVAKVSSPVNTAAPRAAQVSNSWGDMAALRHAVDAAWQAATHLGLANTTRWQDTQRLRIAASARWQAGAAKRTQATTRWQDGTHSRTVASTGWQQGVSARAQVTARYQDSTRLRTVATTSWQQGTARRIPVGQIVQNGRHMSIALSAAWQTGRVPAPGKWVPSATDNPSTGYTPSADLLFVKPYGPSADLIFNWSSDTRTIPVRKVYIVINDVTLRRADTSVEVGIMSLDISIDRESWIQSWSADVKYSEYAALLAGYSDSNALELVATVNGHQYALLAEGAPTRARSFGKTVVKIGGRGISAWLDNPYATTVTHYNDAAMTAQQLMAQALTYNGAALGWSIDWQVTDWYVPAGLFSLRGTAIDGVKHIAEAISAIVQADPYDKTLHVLPYYPAAPWDWDAQTVDVEIPIDVMETDSVAPVIKPTYNRVYVSGTTQGVIARVTRSGTDGATEADQVSHPLISLAAAARQRGLAILGNTGHMAKVTVSMPISDDTGLIKVGQLASIPEPGDNWRGLVGGVHVSAKWEDKGGLRVRQNIELERHYS